MMDWMQDFGSRFDSDEILNGKEIWLDEEEEKHCANKSIVASRMLKKYWVKNNKL